MKHFEVEGKFAAYTTYAAGADAPPRGHEADHDVYAVTCEWCTASPAYQTALVAAARLAEDT